MEKVSAILLMIGEATTSKALAALQQQTYPLEEIIIVCNKSPFSKAFNDGIAQVKTPFFIQCDADMILDSDCVAVLLQKMKGNAGLVHGYLRDPLVGNTTGIKLYRTEVCKKILHANHFNCEAMYVHEVSKQGWELINVDPSAETSLGTHREDISDAAYLFERFRLLGIKIYHRKDWWDLAHRLLMLSLSGKVEAATATDGMICGFFIESAIEDQLTINKNSIHHTLWASIRAKNKRLAFEAFPGFVKKIIRINPSRAGYLIGLSLEYLGAQRLYKTASLDCNESEIIANWSYLFGYTAAMYRFLNNDTGCMNSSLDECFHFLSIWRKNCLIIFSMLSLNRLLTDNEWILYRDTGH